MIISIIIIIRGGLGFQNPHLSSLQSPVSLSQPLPSSFSTPPSPWTTPCQNQPQQSSHAQAGNSCFEIYGFDVMIDSAMKPWLLEVIAHSLGTRGARAGSTSAEPPLSPLGPAHFPHPPNDCVMARGQHLPVALLGLAAGHQSPKTYPSLRLSGHLEGVSFLQWGWGCVRIGPQDKRIKTQLVADTFTLAGIRPPASMWRRS